MVVERQQVVNPVVDDQAGTKSCDGDRHVEVGDLVQDLLHDKNHRVILTVELESCHANRTRHFAIVSSPIMQHKERNTTEAENNDAQEEIITDVMVEDSPRLSPVTRTSSARHKMVRNLPTSELDYCIVGVDSFVQEERRLVTLGFVTKMLWGSEISLDGDGGFGLHVLSKHYIFKPVTLQGLWTAIQTLYAISARLRPKRHSIQLLDQDWVRDYEGKINSPQSCINEWNEMPDLLSRRPLSPDELTVLSRDAANLETRKTVIRSKLREIMKTVDLDDITSKSIRLKLEADLNQKLEEFKAFIDEEILLILGQMDPASKIFDFLYLGSEWNASNLEELNTNGITHILNVTREIDNFFPAVFKYLNIREYDVEETDLLKYWDETFTFIQSCLSMGGKVLVHCKMGISRSASTVCAFAMKEFGWSLEEALQHTKERRRVVNPNQGFRHQLHVYEGILEASRQRMTFHKLHRSMSEGSVKGGKRAAGFKGGGDKVRTVKGLLNLPSEPCLNTVGKVEESVKSREPESVKRRPASWSPPQGLASRLMGEEEQTETNAAGRHQPIICHCYSQLASYFCPGLDTALPTPISGRAWRGEKGVEVVNPLYTLPSREEGQEVVTLLYTQPSSEEGKPREQEEGQPSDTSCPAQSHINQCTCNFEVELQVSEAPVDIQSPLCTSDQRLLRHLGNFPIHLRQAQNWIRTTHITHPNQPISCEESLTDTTAATHMQQEEAADELKNKFSDIDLTVINPDNQTIEMRLDTCGAEELSVKTLADMFDFRLGEVTGRPHLTPQGARGGLAGPPRQPKLHEVSVERIARQLTGGLESLGTMESMGTSLQSEC